MRWTKEELKTRLEALPSHIKTEIIYGVAWDLFGDLDHDESEYIDSEHKPDSQDLIEMTAWFREGLTKERPPVRVEEVIRSGELEIVPGHTLEEIIELSCPLLDDANTWEICGEVLFRGDDDRYYVGTVEFTISTANASYVEDVLKQDNDDEEDD